MVILKPHIRRYKTLFQQTMVFDKTLMNRSYNVPYCNSCLQSCTFSCSIKGFQYLAFSPVNCNRLIVIDNRIQAMTMKLALSVSLMIAKLGAPISEADPGLGSIVFDLIHIRGTLYCTVNTSMGANGTATPVFPSKFAQVILLAQFPSKLSMQGCVIALYLVRLLFVITIPPKVFKP